MIKEERMDTLADYIKRRRYASMDELITLLGVSKATVRRDLLELEKSGLIALTRGGASLLKPDAPHEPTYHEKKDTSIPEKQRIGRAAAETISSGDTVFIAAGTTTRCITPFLDNPGRIQTLNLVTNDLMIATDATGFSNVDVTVTGGQLRKNYYTLRGFVAENLVSHMRFSIAFLGVDAIDPESGCFIANADEISLIQRIISSAQKTVILCDSTKFSNKAFMLVCPLESIDTIITDDRLNKETLVLLREKGVEVITI